MGDAMSVLTTCCPDKSSKYETLCPTPTLKPAGIITEPSPDLTSLDS